jgi:hypothetical protein
MRVLLMIVALTVQLNAGPASELVQGTFQSDKDTTVARWKKDQPWGDRTKMIIAKLGPILGVNRITMKNGKSHSVSGDFTEDSDYRIIKEGQTELVIQQFSKVWNRQITSRIVPDKTGYWVYSDEVLKGYMERYRRIDKTAEQFMDANRSPSPQPPDNATR